MSTMHSTLPATGIMDVKIDLTLLEDI